MKILLIEDDEAKRRQIVELINGEVSAGLICAASLNEAVKQVDATYFDKIVLDMSLPTLNAAGRANAGGRQQDLGGRSFLSYLWELSIRSSVFLVTQLKSFQTEDGRIMTLEELDKILSTDFPGTYVGYAYFHHSTDEWAHKLRGFLNHD